MSERISLHLQECALLAILTHHRGRDNPITQEAAGRAMGFTGGPDTVRRRVQKVRESLMQQGHFICASSRHPAGMWLPQSDEEIDEYYAQVKARALASLRTAAAADRLRARRALEEIQQELGFGPEEIGGENTDYTRVERQCRECGESFLPNPSKGAVQFYCSRHCRYTAANRRRAS